MAKEKTLKSDSKPRAAAQATAQLAANVVEQQGSATGASAGALVNDSPREKRQAEAPETFAGASEGQFVTLAFPLPVDMPEGALKEASIVVTAKAATGRRRAGVFFTREETSIPFADLSEEHLAALTGDAELVVSLRVQKPG